ncbi:MAG: hypothetical protein GY751_26545 [Bacteroidetes bacterium]|nr:hypothetical protein [Bacteroidota bacterium]
MTFWTSIIDRIRHPFPGFIPVVVLLISLQLNVAAQSSYGPSKRASIHEMIDIKQVEIDQYDGAVDEKMDLGNKRDTELAGNTYLTLIDLLQTTIEASDSRELEKYNDLVGVFNLIANISRKSAGYVNYHHSNIYNAYGIISHKSLGTLDRFLYRHMLPSLNNVVLFKDEPIAEAFLKDAADQYPTELLKAVSAFQKEGYAKNVLEHTARVAPNSIKKYFPTRSYINNYLVNSQDSIVQLIMDIYRQYGTESKAYYFLDKVASFPQTKGYYSYLWPESEIYLKELIDIRKKPDPLGEYSLDQELHIQALRYIRPINDMHLMKDATDRFTSVDSLDIEKLYTLIVYSTEEIFTSTYNGIFSRLMAGIQADSVDGFDLLESMNFTRFRTFIKLAAGYNTLNDFIATMSNDNQEKLFARFVNGLGDNLSDLGEAVNVADTFGSLEDSTQLKRFLDHLVLAYKDQRDQKNIYGEVIYSLLISLIGEKIDIGTEVAENVELLDLPPLDYMKVDALINKEEGNIQQHFFFDDDDGLYSYGTFIKNYQNSKWRIVDSTHYIIIESREGNPVKIFANKPLSEREGQKQIKEYFSNAGIAPSIMVHRGHSYYVHLTIDNVQPETKMVFLGSCGGYHNLSSVIDRSPGVHIISSKQIGTVLVNNPLLYAISESIRKGEDIKWAELWDSLGVLLLKDKKATEKFKDYIPPHKNLGAIFLQAYHELTG